MIDSIFVIANNLILMEKHWSIPIPDRRIIDKIKPTSGTITRYSDNKFLVKNSNVGSEIDFVALISEDRSLSYILSALQQVRKVFESYINELTTIKIQENDVILFQVLSEMFDAGFLVITDAEELKEIILPPTTYNNLLDSVTSKGRAKDVVPGASKNGQANNKDNTQQTKTNGIMSSVSSVINRTNPSKNAMNNDNKSNSINLLSNVNNELNLDVLETVNCIINPNGKIIKAEINGEIVADNHFTDTSRPMVYISFINPAILTEQAACNLALDSKINKVRWRDDRCFVYKPDLGRRQITLAKYHLMGSDRGIPIQQVARAMPVNVHTKINFHETMDKGIMLITVNNRTLVGSGNIAAKVQPIQDVIISATLPKFVTTCTVIEDNISSSMGGVSNSIANTLTGSSTASNLSTFDCSTKLLEWKIGKLLHGKPISCKFKINTNLKKPIVKYTVEQREFIYQKNVAVKISFKVDQYTMSGIKLNRVDLGASSSSKLFKTIKYGCRSGEVDFRC